MCVRAFHLDFFRKNCFVHRTDSFSVIDHDVIIIIDHAFDLMRTKKPLFPHCFEDVEWAWLILNEFSLNSCFSTRFGIVEHDRKSE